MSGFSCQYQVVFVLNISNTFGPACGLRPSVRPAAAAAAEADSVINNMHRYDHGVGPQVEGRDGVFVSLQLRVYLLWNLFYFSQSVFDAKKVD